jgi:hypothetical protein
MGFFSAPNTAQIMNSVPAEHRGSASGVRSTVLNAGITASQAIFFTIVIGSLAGSLGPSLTHGAISAGLPPPLAQRMGLLPPGAAIFSAMLGYDPVAHLIPASALAGIAPAVVARIHDPHFFAALLAQPFVGGVRAVLLVCIGMCVLAGVASALRGSDQRAPAPERRSPADEPLPVRQGVAGN